MYKPVYVLVKNELRKVSEFASLPPERRPIAFCPVCHEKVIMKLGDIRIHHYAHTTDNDCPSTYPETALHLNVKNHLYQELLKTSDIYVANRCRSCQSVTDKRLWLSGYDNVEMEYHLDKFIPDIAILKKGNIVGAIEIIVTNDCSEEKATYYKDKNIHWGKVEAKTSLYQGKGWQFGSVFPFDWYFPIGKDICISCENQEKRHQVSIRLKKDRFLTNPKHKSVDILDTENNGILDTEKQWYAVDLLHAVRLIDCYYPKGRIDRKIFYIKKRIEYKWYIRNRFRRDKLLRAWIEDESGERISRVIFSTTERQKLVDDFNKYLESLDCLFVDKPIEWRRYPLNRCDYQYDCPYRYKWLREEWRAKSHD